MAILDDFAPVPVGTQPHLNPGHLRSLGSPTAEDSVGRAPQITIVVPTRGEAGNIQALVDRIDAALGAVRAEILFVDDSDDRTPDVIRATAAQANRTVRLLHREVGHREGRLGGAVIAGFQQARAPWAVVIDGDLQHPPEVLPALLRATESTEVDLVYGTRYFGDGDAGGLSGAGREWVSKMSTKVAKAMFPRKLSGISDPMSGLFAVRLSALKLTELHPVGYKVLLEILANSEIRAAVGVPFAFQERHSGESKASLAEGGRFLLQLGALRLGMTVGRLIQLCAFVAVGISSVGVNTLALWLLYEEWLHLPYLLASAIATNVAVVWTFTLLQVWVFRKVKARSVVGGFVRFWLVSMALLPVQLGLLAVSVEVLRFNPLAGNVVALTLVFVMRHLLTSIWSTRGRLPLVTRNGTATDHGSATGRSSAAAPGRRAQPVNRGVSR